MTLSFFLWKQNKKNKLDKELLLQKNESIEKHKQNIQLQLDVALEAQRMCVWRWNPVTDVLSWDENSLRLFMCDKIDFNPELSYWKSLMHIEDQVSFFNDFNRCLQQERFYFGKYRIVLPNKNIRYVQSAAQIIRNEQDQAIDVVGVHWDITHQENDKIKLQEMYHKIMQNSKLITLGEMSAGISHEINNPLAIISSQCWLVAENLKSKDFNVSLIQDCTDKISNQALRIARIIKGLKSFARDDIGDPYETVSVQNILNESLALCGEKFKKHHVSLFFDVPTIDILVECKPVQISQILVNLLNNAFDAAKTTSFAWVRVFIKSTGQVVQIKISDSGPGVSKDLEEKIMQPFFTTKKIGEGTGLGLSISSSIASEHHGHLSLDRTESDSCFCLTLPLKQQQQKNNAA